MIFSYDVNLEFNNFEQRENEHLTFRTFSKIEIKQNHDSTYIVLHAGENLEILSASYQYHRKGPQVVCRVIRPMQRQRAHRKAFSTAHGLWSPVKQRFGIRA